MPQGREEEDFLAMKITSIGGPEYYTKKSKDKLITATRNCTNNIKINNNKENKKGRKTIWIFQVANQQNLTEEQDLAMKRKPEARN